MGAVHVGSCDIRPSGGGTCQVPCGEVDRLQQRAVQRALRRDHIRRIRSAGLCRCREHHVRDRGLVRCQPHCRAVHPPVPNRSQRSRPRTVQRVVGCGPGLFQGQETTDSGSHGRRRASGINGVPRSLQLVCRQRGSGRSGLPRVPDGSLASYLGEADKARSKSLSVQTRPGEG
ncbi:MAG: hypothetical protein MZV64_37070 [Ignavibacteriales bacterium]|nr:hypothetical protein [Ignavibacteriales bacterium]